MVLPSGDDPESLAAADFESTVFANFTTGAQPKNDINIVHYFYAQLIKNGMPGWNRTNLSVRKLRLQLSGSPFTHRHTKIKTNPP